MSEAMKKSHDLINTLDEKQLTNYFYDFKIVYFTHESLETMRNRAKDSLAETGCKSFLLYFALNICNPELIDENQSINEQCQSLTTQRDALKEALKKIADCGFESSIPMTLIKIAQQAIKELTDGEQNG